MRILIANSNRGLVGGTEAYLRAVLPTLRQRGHDLALLWEYTGQPAIDDGGDGLPHWGPGSIADVARWGPDVVYCHGLSDSGLEGELLARWPAVLFAHNYYGTCMTGTKCHAVPAPQPCERPLGPACLALHYPRRCGGLNPLAAWRSYRTQIRRHALLPRYRAVLAASRHMVDELVRNGVPLARAVLVPLFPPAAHPDPDPPAPRPQTGRVLFVGRLAALKGWRELLVALPIAAARLGRPLTLAVAGDGPDRAAFETEARRRNIAVEFLGWLDATGIRAAMRAADVLAVPSVWPEPFGLVGIEAGCVGLPAVAFAVGGIPDWLAAGISGELAPGGRPDAIEFAAALARALGDAAHWQRLRVGAWKAAGRFTPEAHLDRLLPVLEAAARP